MRKNGFYTLSIWLRSSCLPIFSSLLRYWCLSPWYFSVLLSSSDYGISFPESRLLIPTTTEDSWSPWGFSFLFFLPRGPLSTLSTESLLFGGKFQSSRPCRPQKELLSAHAISAYRHSSFSPKFLARTFWTALLWWRVYSSNGITTVSFIVEFCVHSITIENGLTVELLNCWLHSIRYTFGFRVWLGRFILVLAYIGLVMATTARNIDESLRVSSLWRQGEPPPSYGFITQDYLAYLVAYLIGTPLVIYEFVQCIHRPPKYFR